MVVRSVKRGLYNMALTAALALPLSVLAVTRPASAEPAPASSPSPRRVVAVSITGGAGDEARVLEETIRELLSRLQLMMVGKGVLAPSVSASSLLASVDIDLGAPSANGAAHLVVKSASGSTVIDRTVARDSTAAIQREQIAHAVRGAAEAEILADEDRVAGRAPPIPTPPPSPPVASMEPPLPSPPSPPVVAEAQPVPNEKPLPSPPRGSAFALDLATYGGAGLFADDVGPVARIGGSATLAYRRGLRPSLGLGLFYAFPFESGTSALTSRAHIVSLRLMPAIEVLRRSRFGIDVGVSGGVDFLSVDPSSDTINGQYLKDSTTRADPIVGANVTARILLASDVEVTLSALADVDLTTRRYVFEDRGQRSDVLMPWTLRPVLLAGFSFTAIGESRGVQQ